MHTTLKFSVNTWQHLYSLHQAITHENMLSGNNLHIQGRIRGESLLDKQDTLVDIHFIQSNQSPRYAQDVSGKLVLGKMRRTATKLATNIYLDARVFEELRKNLKEYTAVDGIHVVVSFEVRLNGTDWPVDTDADIIALEYAMKGDA